MNIHMNLFCLIVALATSITDGRISSSSSSSSSQPVGGSAVDMNPNRRVLEPAVVDSETQYCMATVVGKQRSVVDWQEHDQCRMCEVGQTYWPCDGDILCEGHCTPEAVCNERLRLAAAATTAASDCTAVNAEKDDLEAELEGFGAIFAEKDEEITDLKETATTVNAEMATLVGQLTSDATTATTLIESLRVKNDAMIADRDKEITDLKETGTTVNAEMATLKARIVELAEFEASSAATIESLKASIEQKDSMIAEPSLKDDTIDGLFIDLTSQCNADDEKVAFDTCRCSELTVLESELRALKEISCSQVPIDCVNGFVRGGGALTCEKECNGKCCTGGTNFRGYDSPCGAISDSLSSVPGFTGLVHRDGSCSGPLACSDAIIDEVKGSCTGEKACWRAKSTLVDASCNGEKACEHDFKSAKFGPIEGSCNGDSVCRNAKFGSIEGSCNGSNPCDGEITDTVVDGQLFREETCSSGEFACNRLNDFTSIVGKTIYYAPLDYYGPQDFQDVCTGDCISTYIRSGTDNVVGGTSCNNEIDSARNPKFCTYVACNANCSKSFPVTYDPPDGNFLGPYDPPDENFPGPSIPQPAPDAIWNKNRQSCNACGGFWPVTQPNNCTDKYGKDLTECV